MITCSICGKPPPGKFHDGDKCAQCAKMQKKMQRMEQSTPFHQVGDRVLVKRARDSALYLATIRPAAKTHHMNRKAEERYVLVTMDEGSVQTQAPLDMVQVVYRPGEPITDEMLAGLSWLLKNKSQHEVAELVGIPPSTLSGALKRERRSA